MACKSPYRTYEASRFGNNIALDPSKEISLRQFLRAQTDERFIDLIISPVDGVPVEIQESEHAGRGSTFIPIEERLVLCDEETVGCGFGREGRIGILTECALLRLKDC